MGDSGLIYQIVLSIALFLALARTLGLRITTKRWFLKVDMPVFFVIFSGLWCQANGVKIGPENFHLRAQAFHSGDNRITRNGQILMIVSLLVMLAIPIFQMM